ncbi:MAG: hypothetical protein KDC35_14410 [Acidobacteria bacterium]|nr:hypothetical protein [Acidobacteriota bacterium]
MNPMLKNILAVVGGIVAGSIVNMGLVNIGPLVIPLPEGTDVTSMEKLRESMHLFTPSNFLFPFLGHALGTLVGAFVAAKLAATHQLRSAMIIGAFFLVGGIAAVKMIGGPIWFNVVDLICAYLPMGYLGGFLAGRRSSAPST